MAKQMDSTPTAKRHHLDVEPDTPPSTVAMRQLLCEYTQPLKDELSVIGEFMKQTNDKLEQIAVMQKKINVLQNQSDEHSTRITNLEASVKTLQGEVTSLTAKCNNQTQTMDSLGQDSKALRESIIMAECHSRRDNLNFQGIPESRNEDCEFIVVCICQNAGLDIGSRVIVRAHRLGPFNRNRTRPIIVKFAHFKDREATWMSRRHIRSSQFVAVSEDFPEEIKERRKQLFPILNGAYAYRDPENPRFRFLAKLIVDKLVINGTVYTVNNLDRLPEPLRPENLATPSNDDTVVFFTKASPLSNHHPCNFVVGKLQYNCVEQFLMNEKALHFHDTDIAAKIMRTSDPVQQKYFGKHVADFVKTDWQKAVPDILKRGLSAKFGQNIHCKDFLMRTGNKIIGEANPNDMFHGIGISLRDDSVWNRDLWANNLLGKSLMDIRAEL
jgi:hypothetical protein